MEDLFEISLIKELQHLYNCNNKEKTLKVFFLRSMIYNLNFSLKNNEEFIKFLEYELDLPTTNYLIFNNEKIYKKYYGFESSLESIIDNWKFLILDKLFVDIDNREYLVLDYLILKVKKYFNYAKKILKKYPKNEYYNKSLKYIMLKELCLDFNIEFINEKRFISLLEYNTNFLNITFDLECYRYYNILVNNKELEENLENYIFNNFHKTKGKLLFDDISILNRQVTIPNGIIDLLGEDKEKNIVIIELKVVKRPIDIFYQYKAYVSDIKKLYPNKKVRFIAITPTLTKDVYSQLENTKLELYNYKKKYDDFIFTKIF